MPLATKNGAIIVQDGKLAENCACCCALPAYSKFTWTGTPPSSTTPVRLGNVLTDYGFCACYWDTGIPLAKTSKCESYGGIPVGGLSHSRSANISQLSREDNPGSASSYPTYWNISETTVGGNPIQMSMPGDFYAFPSLRATASALYVKDTLIGIHSLTSGTVTGATVSNPYIPGSGHGYTLTAITASEASAIREQQKGRSLKYCDGTWIADPGKPWKMKANVAGWPQGLGQPPLLGQYWQEAWSHEFVLDSLVSSAAGMPLMWSLSASSSVATEGIFSFRGFFQATITDNNAHASGEVPANGGFIGSGSNWPEVAACSGCDTRYFLSVFATLSVRLDQYDAAGGNTLINDTVYCDRAYSPGVSGSGVKWTLMATRRTMAYSTSTGNYSPYIGNTVFAPNAGDNFTFEF